MSRALNRQIRSFIIKDKRNDFKNSIVEAGIFSRKEYESLKNQFKFGMAAVTPNKEEKFSDFQIENPKDKPREFKKKRVQRPSRGS